MTDYIVDISIVSIVVFFALTGYISGLSSKILSLITWGGSTAIGYFLYPYFDPWIASYIKNQLLSSALAFGGVFLLCLIAFSLLSSQLTNSIKNSKAGRADRNLGLVFGLIIGTIFLLLAASSLHFFVDVKHKPPQALQKSRLYPYVQLCLDKVCSLIPGLSRLPQQKFSDQTSQQSQTLSSFRPEQRKSKPEQGYQKPDRQQLDQLIEQVN
ncbi:MAG: hypothetical protein CMM87_04425 [Rickettsiales bacterium]|nr:hypothetical protein [Rickettsiales bacterium]|tara:strand:+ start:31932 stop:32567 length:636 start_codon:yes stop_codon:yes gene_type:complete